MASKYDHSAEARAILEYTCVHGGGTFYPDCTPVELTDGYVVGGFVDKQAGKIGSVIIEQEDYRWHRYTVALPAIERFLYAYYPVLVRNHNVYFGTWRDDVGRIHLDVSQVITDKVDALCTAILRKELAVWDVANKQEIGCLPAIEALRGI